MSGLFNELFLGGKYNAFFDDIRLVPDCDVLVLELSSSSPTVLALPGTGFRLTGVLTG